MWELPGGGGEEFNEAHSCLRACSGNQGWDQVLADGDRRRRNVVWGRFDLAASAWCPQSCPINGTRIQRPPPASMASRNHRFQQLGDGVGRLLYTTACRGVTCSAISRPASISVRRSSQVFCRFNQSCGVVPK